jgi:urea transporter
LKSKYKNFLKLNKNLLIAAGIAFIVSAAVAQQLSELESYLNTTITLLADFTTFYLVFTALFLFDNRKKYKSNSNKTDWYALKRDLVKIVSSLGVGEVVYLTSRWFGQFHFLNLGIEAYQASVFAMIIAFVLFMIVTNIVVKLMKLYK